MRLSHATGTAGKLLKCQWSSRDRSCVGANKGCSSFANTDLDYHLRQRDITHVVVAGMVANTCLESTARYAVEM